MPRGPVSDEERARIVELHGAGHSRNKIAEDMDRPPSTITRLARELGLAFDRSQVKEANEARKVDLAAMRAELATMALVKAKGFLEALDRPYLVHSFGGRDNEYNEHTLDRPPAADMRNLMTSYGIAVQRSMDLSKFDADPNEGGAAVDAWLAHMIGDE